MERLVFFTAPLVAFAYGVAAWSVVATDLCPRFAPGAPSKHYKLAVSAAILTWAIAAICASLFWAICALLLTASEVFFLEKYSEDGKAVTNGAALSHCLICFSVLVGFSWYYLRNFW